MNCPRCHSGATVAGACASCGYGIRPSYAPRRHTTASAPYQRKSQTSRAGAVAVVPKVLSQRDQIVAYVKEHGPCTRSEISAGLGDKFPINVVTARVSDALYNREASVWSKKPPRPAELQRGRMRICRVSGHMAETVEAIPVQGAML